MALQLKTSLRNARADLVESSIGTSPILRILDGAPPANCAAATTGTTLALINLPSDWLTAAANGVKSINGTWTDASANATGTASYFRIHDAADSACWMQGTCTVSGGGGDMILSTVSLVAGGSFSVTTFTLTESGA